MDANSCLGSFQRARLVFCRNQQEKPRENRNEPGRSTFSNMKLIWPKKSMIFGMKYFEFVFWHLLTSIVLWCTCVLRTITEPHSKVEQTCQQNMSVGNHGSKTLRGNMRRNYNHLDASSPSNPPTLFTQSQLLRILYVTTSQWTNLTENHEHGHSPQMTVLQICGIGHCEFTGYKMD